MSDGRAQLSVASLLDVVDGIDAHLPPEGQPPPAVPAPLASVAPGALAEIPTTVRRTTVREVSAAVLEVLADVGENASLAELVVGTQDALIQYTVHLLEAAGRLTQHGGR